jgi:hypothetical protein
MDTGNIISLLAIATSIGLLIISFLRLPHQQKLDEKNGDLLDAKLFEDLQKIIRQQSIDNNTLIMEKTKMEKDKETLKIEKDALKQEMASLRDEVKIMDDRHCDELNAMKEEFDKKFEEMQKENVQWRDYAMRLVFQVRSWSLIPVPFDIIEAKKKGESLGEFGRITGLENLAPNSTKTNKDEDSSMK